MPVSSNGSGYLERLLDVLEVVALEDPRRLSELAARIGMPLSSASRLTSLLAARELVSRGEDSRFRPGPRLIQIGVRAQEQVEHPLGIEHVVDLVAERCSESVSAGLVVEDRILLVARRESVESLRAVARVGDVISPHTSAMGKAVLAFLPAVRRSRLLRQAGVDPEPVLAALEEELDGVRGSGVGLDEQTYAVGLRCRAVPILGHGGTAIGGVSVAGPAARFTLERANEIVPYLAEQVTRLSRDPAGTT